MLNMKYYSPVLMVCIFALSSINPIRAAYFPREALPERPEGSIENLTV